MGTFIHIYMSIDTYRHHILPRIHPAKPINIPLYAHSPPRTSASLPRPPSPIEAPPAARGPLRIQPCPIRSPPAAIRPCATQTCRPRPVYTDVRQLYVPAAMHPRAPVYAYIRAPIDNTHNHTCAFISARIQPRTYVLTL